MRSFIKRDNPKKRKEVKNITRKRRRSRRSSRRRRSRRRRRRRRSAAQGCGERLVPAVEEVLNMALSRARGDIVVQNVGAQAKGSRR